jgi:hypothetical protein
MNKCPECNAQVELGMQETYLTNNGVLHSITQCVKNFKLQIANDQSLKRELVEALKGQHGCSQADCYIKALIARASESL